MGKRSIIIITVVFYSMFIAFIYAIILFIKEYKKKKKDHIKKLEEIDLLHKKELLETTLEIQSLTMSNIGREIHDNVGQKLTYCSLLSQQTGNNSNDAKIKEQLENITNTIDESLEELRQLSRSLTNDNIQSFSFVELLKNECKRIEELQKCKVILKASSTGLILSYNKKIMLIRVIQEFFQNSIKHSDCNTISITIRKENNLLKIVLMDDGDGFDLSKIKSLGIGLTNMKKRIEMIDGTLKLKSVEKLGTTIKIKLPLS